MKNNHSYINTSKIDWLNKIPNHWKEVRLGSVFNERKEKVSDKDFPPLSVTKNGIVPQLENAAKSNDGDNRKLVLSGDFAINSRSDRKGSSGLSIYDGSVSLINIVLRPIDIVPIFSQYLLKSYFFKEEYYRYGRGIVEDLWTTRYSEMKNMIIPIPPKQEQTTIANFLDYKTEKINRFITKKKQLVKLLNEQKAAIINQAVMKGLDPNVPMKDSGIEWLGDIPAHWVTKPLKYFVTHNDEALSNSTDKEYELNYIDIGNVDSNGDIEEIVKYKFKDAPSRARRIVKAGDVIISTVRTYLKAIAIIEDDQNVIVSTGFAVLRPRKSIVGEFLNYAVRANYFIEDVCSNSFGVSYPAINASELVTLKLAVPNNETEQKNIVEFINNESKTLDKTISTIEKEITLVEEYKTALIAEAVTGKIDVRDFKLPTQAAPLAMVAEEASNYNKRYAL